MDQAPSPKLQLSYWFLIRNKGTYIHIYYIIQDYIHNMYYVFLPYSLLNPKFGQDWVRKACGAQLRSEVPRGLRFMVLGFRA